MTTTATTTRAAAALLLLTSGASASNPFNWTPSVSLLDGTGEVNKNGFCLRVPGDGCDNNKVIKGSSCLPDDAPETRFGYHQYNQTIYAANITCSEDEAVSSCLTVEAPVKEGSNVVLTDCAEDNSLQTFVYTSSGKFLVAVDDDDDTHTSTNSSWCLGMGEDIVQQGSSSPYVDPTFWRDLVLLDCNNATDDTLVTWLVDPRPIDNVLEDGPFPGDEDVDELEWDEGYVFGDNSTNTTNVTFINEDTEETLSEETVAPMASESEVPLTSISKRSGGLRRILDEGM